jgi:hypothetical protein
MSPKLSITAQKMSQAMATVAGGSVRSGTEDMVTWLAVSNGGACAAVNGPAVPGRLQRCGRAATLARSESVAGFGAEQGSNPRGMF